MTIPLLLLPLLLLQELWTDSEFSAVHYQFGITIDLHSNVFEGPLNISMCAYVSHVDATVGGWESLPLAMWGCMPRTVWALPLIMRSLYMLAIHLLAPYICALTPHMHDVNTCGPPSSTTPAGRPPTPPTTHPMHTPAPLLVLQDNNFTVLDMSPAWGLDVFPAKVYPNLATMRARYSGHQVLLHS